MEMRANGNVGFKDLYADNIVSDSVVNAYKLTNTLIVSTTPLGNYYNVFPNIREACAFVNNMYLKEDVTVTFYNTTRETVYDTEGIIVEGISGPGKLIIDGRNQCKTVKGFIDIKNCSTDVSIVGLDLSDPRPRTGGGYHPALIYARLSSYVGINSCNLNCNNLSSTAFFAQLTNSHVESTQISNVNTGLEATGCLMSVFSVKGRCTYSIESDSAIVFCREIIPVGTLSRQGNGVIYNTGTTTNAGSTSAVQQPDSFMTFDASMTRTYQGGWQNGSNDMIQGVFSGTGYNASLQWGYGCLWFNTLRTALAGKTIRAAYLSVWRMDGGTGSATKLHLYGISNTTNSGVCTTNISHGDLGSLTIGWGKLFSLPISVIQRLVSGADGGLCFYETPVNFGANAHSYDYTRLAGVGHERAPKLTVVYA